MTMCRKSGARSINPQSICKSILFGSVWLRTKCSNHSSSGPNAATTVVAPGATQLTHLRWVNLTLRQPATLPTEPDIQSRTPCLHLHRHPTGNKSARSVVSWAQREPMVPIKCLFVRKVMQEKVVLIHHTKVVEWYWLVCL